MPARNGLNIVVLDACRNNPINLSAHGLSRIDSNESLFVSYSTSPARWPSTAKAATAPTPNISPPRSPLHLNIEETFKRTLKSVYVETKSKQCPISSTFFGDFVFGLRVDQRLHLIRRRQTQAAARSKRPWSGRCHPQQAPREARARRRLSRERHQPQRQPLYRHRRPRGGRRRFQAHLVDRQGRVPRQRAFRRQDAGDQLGRQAPGDLQLRRRRRARRRMGRRLGQRDADAGRRRVAPTTCRPRRGRISRRRTQRRR